MIEGPSFQKVCDQVFRDAWKKPKERQNDDFGLNALRLINPIKGLFPFVGERLAGFLASVTS
jgi:hypothetical protein